MTYKIYIQTVNTYFLFFFFSCRLLLCNGVLYKMKDLIYFNNTVGRRMAVSADVEKKVSRHLRKRKLKLIFFFLVILFSASGNL